MSMGIDISITGALRCSNKKLNYFINMGKLIHINGGVRGVWDYFIHLNFVSIMILQPCQKSSGSVVKNLFII